MDDLTPSRREAQAGNGCFRLPGRLRTTAGIRWVPLTPAVRNHQWTLAPIPYGRDDKRNAQNRGKGDGR